MRRVVSRLAGSVVSFQRAICLSIVKVKVKVKGGGILLCKFLKFLRAM